MHNVLDLFSGIGGFSLGLERTGGFTTSAFCEICPEARKVLRKHWADVPIYEDITKLTAERLHNDGIEIDCITGGFPCQDISLAGKGKGIVGERSGLWAEMFRLIADVRPRWVIAENVSALRSKGLTLVLQDLSSLGYHAEWHCIPASAVGAPHQRDRIWIIAYPKSGIFRGGFKTGKYGELHDTRKRPNEVWRNDSGIRLPFRKYKMWETEPNMGRVVVRIPRELDKVRRNRIKQLGNSVVPQIPELIGNAILKKEGKHGCCTGIE